MQPASSAFDYAQLPVEHRLHLVGLPIAQGRKRGRPRELTFRERVRVAQAWGETLNRHAIHVHDRKRDRRMAKLQARFGALCAAKAHPHEIAKVVAAIDKIGRVTRVAIKPPDTALPVIDKQLAKLFGITERMVRKCRTDPKLRPFMPHPVWIERDWVKAARLDFEARQIAKRLMTPERFAKQESVRLFNGGLQVPPRVGIEWEIIQAVGPGPEPNNPSYRPASALQLDAHAGPPDWFAMQMLLVEMEGLSDRRARVHMRKRGGELGTITAPYPPVTAGPMTVPAYANFG